MAKISPVHWKRLRCVFEHDGFVFKTGKGDHWKGEKAGVARYSHSRLRRNWSRHYPILHAHSRNDARALPSTIREVLSNHAEAARG